MLSKGRRQASGETRAASLQEAGMCTHRGRNPEERCWSAGGWTLGGHCTRTGRSAEAHKSGWRQRKNQELTVYVCVSIEFPKGSRRLRIHLNGPMCASRMSMRQRSTGMAQDMVGARTSAICGSAIWGHHWTLAKDVQILTEGSGGSQRRR